MKPRKSFFADIAEVLHKLDHQRLLASGPSPISIVFQFFSNMHGMSLRLRCLHAASACPFSKPAKRARNRTLSPFSRRSVNGSALPSISLALLCAASRRCLASFSSGSAPTRMSQPPRGLAAGSTFAAAVGGLFAVVATLTGAISELGADGKTDAADAGEGVTVGAAAKVVGRSLLTVEIVVMLAALATAGAGVSWRLSVGTG